MIGENSISRFVRCFCALALFVNIGLALAAESSIAVRTDKPEVVVGEAFRLTLEVRNAGGGNFEPQLPKEFEIVGRSSQSSFSFGTGRGSERVQRLIFSVVGLAAGKYQLGPFSTTLDGKKVVSNSAPIRVVADSRELGQGGAGKKRGKDSGSQARDVFLTTSLSKRDVWVGEPFTLSIKFYFRVQVANSSLLDADFSHLISFDGKDVPQTESKEVVDGVEYNVITVHKTYAARSAGTIQIPQMRLQTEVPVSRRARNEDAADSDDPFEAFGGMMANPFFERTERKILAAPAVSVAVRALPEPKPAGWLDVVGDVKISAELSKNRLAVGENATLTLRAEGAADLAAMTVANLGAGDGVKTYPDKPTLDSQRDAQGMLRQRKVFSVGVVPTREGRLTIRGQSLFVFNPQQGAYEEKKLPEFVLEVLGGSDSFKSVLPGEKSVATAKQGVKESGSDIFPPKENWARLSSDERTSALGILAWLSPTILMSLIWLALSLRNSLMGSRWREGGHYVAKKAFSMWRRDATRIRKRLVDVRSSSDNGLEEELARCVRSYLENRMGVSATAMTSEEVFQLLLARGASPELSKECSDILSRLDMGRYAGTVGVQPLMDVFGATEKVLEKIEKEVRV